MDVKKLYEEQMKLFFDLHSSIRDTVYVVFKPAKLAGLDDLHDARILAEKTKAVKAHLDSMLAIKNMKANGQKLSTD